MKEIGEYLHQIREEKNISLKEIQEATKISMRYLEAIDRGDFEGIPGEVYRKGFIVNFANAIGLDGQEIIQRYNQMKASKEAELLQTQNPVIIPEAAKKSNDSKNSDSLDHEQIRGLYLGIVVALIGILIVASFFLFPAYHKNSNLEEVTFPNVNSEQAKSEETEKPDNSNLPAPITVNAVFKEKVWVQIQSDGDYLYGADGMTFEPSQPEQIWTAQRVLIIKMGNPAGVSLTFNGKELGQLGERGNVKVIRLTAKGLEAL